MRQRLHTIHPGLWLACGLFLLLALLGMQAHKLWGDEAETALFAQNVLHTGIPYGWDGTNLMGLYDGIVLDKHLVNNTSPWAQYYVAAVGLKLFGNSTFAARIPFVLFSLASLPLLFALAKRLFNEKVALFSVFFLSVSVPFLLYAYQARYNALTIFATLWVFLAFLRVVDKQKYALINATAACVFFFYSHHLAFTAFVPVLTVLLLLFQKKERQRLFVDFIRIALATVLLTLPWLLLLKPFATQQEHTLINFNLKNGTELFLRYLKDFHDNGGLPFTLIPLLLILVTQTKQKFQKSIIFLGLLSFGFLYLLSLLSIQPLDVSKWSDIRYAMNIYPILSLFTAFVVYAIFEKNHLAGIMTFILMAVTTIPTLNPAPQLLLKDYLTEATTGHFQTSTEVVIDYLRKTLPTDTQPYTLVFPDYYVEPLQFFLPDRMRFINRISPDNEKILELNRSWLPAYIYAYDEFPDLIIAFDKRYINEAVIKSQNYEEIHLPVYAHDLSRPEMYLHRFQPITNYPETESVFIFKKRGS